MNKELLQQKAEDKYHVIKKDTFFGKDVSDHNKQNLAKQNAFLEGAAEILDNPELYDLVKKDKYHELWKENYTNFMELDVCTHNQGDLQKENKELQEKITQLETVIDRSSKKIINKSNY